MVLDRVPLFGATGFATFPFVTSLGLVNYVIQAGQIHAGDQCADARWTAQSNATLNIMGASQSPTPPFEFAQAVVRSWEDGSVRTRIWQDPATTLTVQR